MKDSTPTDNERFDGFRDRISEMFFNDPDNIKYFTSISYLKQIKKDINKHINIVKKQEINLKKLIELYNHKEIQIVLKSLGYNLIIDGIIGDITKKIIIDYGIENLEKELKKINNSGFYKLCWVKIAMNEFNIHEKPNNESRITEYHKIASGINWGDYIPWCGSFLAYVFKKCNFKLPVAPYRALSWLTFGIKLTEPKFGAIAIKKRTGGGHVCIVVGITHDKTHIYCLGGNQNDKVSIVKYPISTFAEFRYPFGYDAGRYPLENIIISNLLENGNKIN